MVVRFSRSRMTGLWTSAFRLGAVARRDNGLGVGIRKVFKGGNTVFCRY